jgi:3-deoxy-manno-octulosonate cytidylyltransferase (CMP-KDO synthetase)
MIWWVYQQAKKVTELDEVIVATDDERIRATCAASTIPVIMTSPIHPTGTDREAEVAETIIADVAVLFIRIILIIWLLIMFAQKHEVMRSK